MRDNWLPRLSSTARALIAAERGRREDEGLKARALERAEGALEGERWSGVGLRQASRRSLLDIKPRVLRGTLLAAAAVAFAGLAAAGVKLVVSRSQPANVVAAIRATPPAVTAKAGLSLPPSLLDAEVIVPPTPAPVAGIASGAAPARGAGAKPYATELALLEPARGSIARGDFSSALRAIAKHEREYPSGALVEEREALRVRALWGIGQQSAAERAAASFQKRYPRSVLLSWMKRQPAR